MRSAYVENKDYRGLVASFDLKFGRRFVRVFIWKSKVALRKNTYFSHGDQVGAYVLYPDRKPRAGLFGEVHLINRLIGGGYVAHELQHFFFDWLMDSTWDADISERLALLTGNITRDFWTQFYKVKK